MPSNAASSPALARATRRRSLSLLPESMHAYGGTAPARRLPGTLSFALALDRSRVAHARDVGQTEEGCVAHELRDAHPLSGGLLLELRPELGRKPNRRCAHSPFTTREEGGGWTVGGVAVSAARRSRRRGRLYQRLLQ